MAFWSYTIHQTKINISQLWNGCSTTDWAWQCNTYSDDRSQDTDPLLELRNPK